MSIIISVSNQKGGVSKTVSSYNLASCLALNHNRKVLLADIDPQANLSEYLGYTSDKKVCFPTKVFQGGLLFHACYIIR